MQLSLKKKIVIWYTIWMSILSVLFISVAFASSGYVSDNQARTIVVESVMDAVEEFYDEGWFEPYEDGIFISLLDGENNVLFGQLPREVSSISSTDGKVSVLPHLNADWYVYDYVLSNGMRIRGAYSLNGISQIFSFFFTLSLIVFPLLVLLAAVGGYFITRKAFAPLDKMSRTAAEISTSADLSKRVDVKDASHEIRLLASSFDNMLDRLEDAFRKERQFTDDASHELRTPVALIRSEAEYMLMLCRDKALCEEIDEIINQCDRMTGMLNQLLTLARSDSGRYEAKFEYLNLSQLCDVLCSSMEGSADEKGLTLTKHITENLYIEADESLVMRALSNLISNALKYTDKGGCVDVSLEDGGSDVILRVCDTGTGISAGDLPHIFDRFYQADPSRSGGGSGLGLSIVSWICSVHKTTCTVESTEGKGSVFSVKFHKVLN